MLLHGWAYPAHERLLAEIARGNWASARCGLSHEISGLIKFVPRADTTVADAYLSPVLRGYVDGSRRPRTKGDTLLFMQSDGGLAARRRLRGRDAVLSGPAGGVVGPGGRSQRAGFDTCAGFDMGGTSTDVRRYAGAFERTNETRSPACGFSPDAASSHRRRWRRLDLLLDGTRLRVGPHSAGAISGPRRYRRGGPLT